MNRKAKVYPWRDLQSVMHNWQNTKISIVLKPQIKKTRNRYILSFLEDWQINDENIQSTNFDERLKWIEDELSKYQDAVRIDFETYEFKSKDTLDKFLTIYYLKWHQDF